jgi:hypothetical protein
LRPLKHDKNSLFSDLRRAVETASQDCTDAFYPLFRLLSIVWPNFRMWT